MRAADTEKHKKIVDAWFERVPLAPTKTQSSRAVKAPGGFLLAWTTPLWSWLG
jgi:hypothetical protein